MNWFVVVLTSAALAATINHIDKFLITKRFQGGNGGSIVILSAMMAIPLMVLIGLMHPSVFSLQFRQFFPIILNGVIYVSWLLPYYYALGQDDASGVTPLFQLAAVFSYLIGFLVLGEQMSFAQWVGALLICIGSMGLSLKKFSRQGISLKKEVLLPMATASFFVALNNVLFKFFAIEEGFWIVAFWEFAGFIITASVLLIVVKTYRTHFIQVIKKNKLSILGLCFTNEILTSAAKMTLNFAALLAPVALVMFVAEGFQPFFVLTIGILLTIFFPHLSKENIEKKHLLQKIVSLFVMFAGTLLLVLKQSS